MNERFTKGEAAEIIKAVERVSKDLPKKKIPDNLSDLNDIFLFLEAAKEAAPEGPARK